MDPLTIGSLIAGIGGGLFGGKGRRNQFGQQVNQNADALAGVRNTYASNATRANSNYNNYNGKYFGAVDAYGDNLRRDPFTDSYSARVIDQATTGTNDAYNAAKAGLRATAARDGVMGGSTYLADNADIEARRAGTFANAQNNLAMAKVAKREQNLQNAVGLYGNVANTERAAANQALSGQAGVASNLLSSFTGANNTANAQAAYDDQNLMNGIGGAANLFGILAGRGGSRNPFGIGSVTGINGGQIDITPADEQAMQNVIAALALGGWGG